MTTNASRRYEKMLNNSWKYNPIRKFPSGRYILSEEGHGQLRAFISAFVLSKSIFELLNVTQGNDLYSRDK
ncbi:hypothetical protein KIN20_000946 [Parelaphostrongylus tenuis]|uniref:Uncharacterized protein n=1 Tax=Parelaphostrongylus tenuis TaxID=148309 RepID=A0AAD5MBX4_PARTN|nr:hypothetical protein KIN20_000946 [Parelaphostrongylus tenuis]